MSLLSDVRIPFRYDKRLEREVVTVEMLINQQSTMFSHLDKGRGKGCAVEKTAMVFVNTTTRLLVKLLSVYRLCFESMTRRRVKEKPFITVEYAGIHR